MFGKLIGQSTFLDREVEDWMLETWAWLMRNLGGAAVLADTPLVTPTPEFFPPTTAKGAERSAYVFDQVKLSMDMADWDCELVEVERRPQLDRVGEYWHVQSEGAAAGTFEMAQGKVVISYAADLASRPHDLIATFAHELAHYLLATIDEPVPGGEDAHELATDLAVAYAGFGVFGANAAFSFKQHGDTFGQGWSSQRSGYLSERSWAFAIALFLTLKGSPGSAAKWLKPSVAALVEAAERYLAGKPDRLGALTAIA